MISITRQPLQNNKFNPSHACIEWCLNTDELYSIQALAKAAVSITFLPLGTIAGYLEFQNNAFNIGGSLPYTQSTFQMNAGNTFITATNLVGAFKCVPEIYENFNITIIRFGATTVVLCESKKCGYIAPGVFTVSNITPGGRVTISFSQGTGIKRPDYNLAWQLVYVDKFAVNYMLQKIQVVKPSARIYTNCTMIDECIDFSDLIKAQLYTPLPFADAHQFVFEDAMLKKFYLKYGSVESLGCDATTIYFKDSPTILALNQAKETFSLDGPTKFVYVASPEQLSEYLNLSIYSGLSFSIDSFMWAYAYLNYKDYYGTASFFVLYTLFDGNDTQLANFEVEIFSNTFTYANDAGVLRIPIGPKNLIISDPATCRVRVRGRAKLGISTFPIFKDIDYRIDKALVNTYEFYFLCPRGGYDTINFASMEEVVMVTAQTEYCYKDYCRDYTLVNTFDRIKDYLKFLFNNGKDQYNTIASRKFKVKSKQMPNTKAVKNYFEAFLTSENRFYRIDNDKTSIPSTWVNAPKIMVEHIDRNIDGQGKVTYEFTFRFAMDTNTIADA